MQVDGTGTSVLSARVAGGATFQNVDARNVGAVGINNCGSFHFTPAGSEFTVTDGGGNDGGGTTGSVDGVVGAAQHDHVRRPPPGRGACRTLGMVIAAR